MKILKTSLFVLFVSIMASCSSDSDSSDNNSDDAYFNYTVDGQTVALPTVTAIKKGAQVAVSGTAANGANIGIEFNEHGNLASVSVLQVIPISIRMAYGYDIKDFFTFNLISLEDGMVKGTFTGKVYDDMYDLTSNFSLVEGSFYVPYTTQEEEVPGLGLTATLAGSAWYSSSLEQYSGSDGSQLIFSSDDKYQIAIAFDPDTVAEQSYAFSNTSVTKVVVSKYNTAQGYPEEFVSSPGTLVITDVTESGTVVIIEGTFSVTATHPDTNEQVTVTNGHFKGYYDTF